MAASAISRWHTVTFCVMCDGRLIHLQGASCWQALFCGGQPEMCDEDIEVVDAAGRAEARAVAAPLAVRALRGVRARLQFGMEHALAEGCAIGMEHTLAVGCAKQRDDDAGCDHHA